MGRRKITIIPIPNKEDRKVPLPNHLDHLQQEKGRTFENGRRDISDVWSLCEALVLGPLWIHCPH
jgi:hypothetical protein